MAINQNRAYNLRFDPQADHVGLLPSYFFNVKKVVWGFL